MTTQTETPAKKDISTMTSAELKAHIEKKDKTHRAEMTTLRALQKAREAEEQAAAE